MKFEKNSITADMTRWLFQGSWKMTTFTRLLPPTAKATILWYYGMVLFKNSWKICLKGVFTAYRGPNSSILLAKWGKFMKWGNFVGPPQLQRAVWGLRWGFKIEVRVLVGSGLRSQLGTLREGAGYGIMCMKVPITIEKSVYRAWLGNIYKSHVVTKLTVYSS